MVAVRDEERSRSERDPARCVTTDSGVRRSSIGVATERHPAGVTGDVALAVAALTSITQIPWSGWSRTWTLSNADTRRPAPDRWLWDLPPTCSQLSGFLSNTAV
jgi:hypothetical protein